MPKDVSLRAAAVATQGTPISDSLRPARFVFFDEEMKNFHADQEIKSSSVLGDRLYRAGLIENSADLPVVVARFGLFFSLSEFARLAARSKEILTFGADHQRLDLSSSEALVTQLQDYAQKANRGKSQGKGKSKDKSEEKSKPRSEPYGKGGYGKGDYGRGNYQRRWY